MGKPAYIILARSLMINSHFILIQYQELSGWYEQNAIQLEKLRAANREAMITANKTFVAELEPLEPGTEWDRLDNIFEYFYKFVSGLPSFVILTQKVQKM